MKEVSMHKPATDGLRLNLRNLDKHDLHLRGKLSVEELELESVDEVIHPVEPLMYDIEAQKLEHGILVRGVLRINLDCECVRCLKKFKYRLELSDWTALLALEGEETVEVLDDTVDLTPVMREDILLGFPQHPLCKPECGGLPKKAVGKGNKTGIARQTPEVSSTWAELNKLKF
jgi:uncharacterized protein